VVLNSLMEISRPAGSIGIPGLYVTEDPGAKDEAAKRGSLSLRLGLGCAKSNSLHTGQTPVLRYNRQLMEAILWDRLPIAKVVNVKVISLDEAPEGYKRMDGAWIGSIDVSINKAFTARAFDISTADLAKESQPGKQFYGIQGSNHGRIMIFAGGIPFRHDGKVVGAIGVSGGSGIQDQAVAAAGASAFES
jgi:uncharacterized protein GlcG (DUF336 family)